MISFLDLPTDLLPLILQHIIKPHHLAKCCLVNRAFHSFTVPLLYERIFIYAWHKDGKTKVRKLFETLSEYPQLAKYVKKLELRDFPRAIYSTASHESLTKSCITGLVHCRSLRSCTWTRDQTLSGEILEALSSCISLKELEINGHSTGTYDARLLLLFKSLTKISLIMPSAEVVDILPQWLMKNKETLTAFHVLCKSSSLITNDRLAAMAPYMTRLRHLHIVGCPRITHRGILAVIRHNTASFESLGLEGLSPTFELPALAEVAPLLTSLNSLTLTLPSDPLREIWPPAFHAFTAHAPLTEIHIYITGGMILSLPPRPLMENMIAPILNLHAVRLRKLSVNRLKMRPHVVENICVACPNLETLFVVVEGLYLDDIVTALAKSKSIRNIHVNFAHNGSDARVPIEDVRRIAERLGSQVRQLGFANRVYQLDRVAVVGEDGETVMHLAVATYEHPEVPEQFLVVRT
ncbi:hypothetical protein BU17DRAFT_55597 [Hysterangium stoloniferum]|nr:hypothetical protein BU17DRAFT_55597 [Hysterangium stoloniferum]